MVQACEAPHQDSGKPPSSVIALSVPGPEQERYHFDKMTDLFIYSHEEGVAKPDRRMYELTCERLGVQPAEMIFLFLPGHERGKPSHYSTRASEAAQCRVVDPIREHCPGNS